MVTFLMRESLQPPPMPMIADVMADDGISWSRLVTAVVLLGLSLAIGYRTSRDPRPEPVPQPVHESVVAAVELPRLDATVVDAPAPLPDVAAPASPMRVNTAGHAQSRRAVERRHVGRAANRAADRQGARPRRNHAALAGREPATTRRSFRSRAQVRGEYLRNREVVAALTGEDSGSAYLTRVAARQRAARLEVARSRRR